MKLKYDFVINEVAGKKVAVAVGDSLEKFNGFIKMNENSAFVLQMLKSEVTEEEIVLALVKEFSVEDNQELRENLRDLLLDFKKRGMIE